MAKVRHLGLFPFCVQSLNGLSKLQATEMFWRVRSWEVTASSGNLSSEETQYEPPVGLVLTNSLTTERDLICRATVVSMGYWIAESGELQGELQEFLRVVAGKGFYNNVPVFTFAVETGITEIGGKVGLDVGGENGDGTLVGKATVELQAGNVEIDLFSRYSGSTSELNVTIAPFEYWPYE